MWFTRGNELPFQQVFMINEPLGAGSRIGPVVEARTPICGVPTDAINCVQQASIDYGFKWLDPT